MLFTRSASQGPNQNVPDQKTPNQDTPPPDFPGPAVSRLSGEDIAYIREVREQVNAAILDQSDVIDGVLAALLCQGHVLIESNPGLGKTSLVKAFAAALGFRTADAGRIQFTPDLLPSDITGTLMRREDGGEGLAFTRGPVFRWLLLADEINRASPKTQAAMLEAMAEKQVTVLGKTYALPDGEVFEHGVRPPPKSGVESPFMVLATQNPIDHEGTYELPEAQADRFMFKLLMDLPSSVSLQRIANGDTPLQRFSPAARRVDDNASAKLARIGRAIAAIELSKPAAEHVLAAVQASNRNWRELQHLPKGALDALKRFVGAYLQYPLGPRAAIALFAGAKAFHLIKDVRKEEVHQVARTVPAAGPLWDAFLPALRHRLKLTPDWERIGRQDGLIPGGDSEAVARDRVVAAFVEACAPSEESRRGVAAYFAAYFAARLQGSSGDRRG
jgi:MoxR-like ATPase